MSRNREALRAMVKAAVPRSWRRRIARANREFPARAVDWLPDLAERVSRTATPLPPPALRRRVSGTSSRELFLRTGRTAFESIVEAFFRAAGDAPEKFPRWLDFGCGAGRVARHFAVFPPIHELCGVDIDREAIDWCSSRLPGRFLAISPAPPLPFEPGRFDVVYAGSVFTHLDPSRESAWLSELHRVLRSGGLLIATTHSPALTFTRPDLSENQHRALAAKGALFAPGGQGFNEDTAFHSREYLLREWGRLFGLELYFDHGLDGFQDLSVWRKW